jgi:hypothetical protein
MGRGTMAVETNVPNSSKYDCSMKTAGRKTGAVALLKKSGKRSMQSFYL